MHQKRNAFFPGVLTLVFAVLFQVQAQQPGPAVQPRPAVQPPRPAATAVQQPSLKFAILGDTGTGGTPQYEIGQKLTAVRATFPFEFVIMLGDNMYGGDSAKDFQNKFEKPYQALLSAGIKFYASLGNHDVPDRQIAYKPFNMGGQRYYTFKPKDGVRFFALDSNYMDKKQLDWLKSELKSSGSEWKILLLPSPSLFIWREAWTKRRTTESSRASADRKRGRRCIRRS